MILINKQKVEDIIYSKYNSTSPLKNTLSEILDEITMLKLYDDRHIHIGADKVVDMCMKEQEHLILRYKLKEFIKMIEALPSDTNKGSIWKKVFNNKLGEELKDIVL